jgi:hypothetical protein
MRRYLARLAALQVIPQEEVPILQYPFLSGIVRLKALFSPVTSPRWRQLGHYYRQVCRSRIRLAAVQHGRS